MGNKNYPCQIQHFSHAHPLELFDFKQHIPNFLCSGCKLQATGLIYYCKICTYPLHIACSQLPQQINHPAHSKHTLTLQATHSHPRGIFDCEACGVKGNAGFSYNCSYCNFDIHSLCSTYPLSAKHQAHAHPLNLTLSPPYESKGFSCDICKGPGLHQWLYRCNLCEFDTHLHCAAPQHQPLPQHQHQPLVQPQNQHQTLLQQQYQYQSPVQQQTRQLMTPQLTQAQLQPQQFPPQYQSPQVYPPGTVVQGTYAGPQQIVRPVNNSLISSRNVKNVMNIGRMFFGV